MKLTALGVTFKCLKLVFLENRSAGSREEASGSADILEM
jgi:hypothetical protein